MISRRMIDSNDAIEYENIVKKFFSLLRDEISNNFD